MHDSVCMWKIGDVNIRESINVGEVLRFEKPRSYQEGCSYCVLSTEFNKIYVPNTNKQKQKQKKIQLFAVEENCCDRLSKMSQLMHCSFCNSCMILC